MSVLQAVSREELDQPVHSIYQNKSLTDIADGIVGRKHADGSKKRCGAVSDHC